LYERGQGRGDKKRESLFLPASVFFSWVLVDEYDENFDEDEEK